MASNPMGRKPVQSASSKATNASLRQTQHYWTSQQWHTEPVPLLCGLIFLAVVLVFGQTVRHDFINFDDPDYVLENAQVAGGVSADGIAWAFTEGYAANWHPLTWISHMLDCQFFGLSAGGHHLTSMLIHAATAILLFLVLGQMTGAVWPCALAAAAFAVHPLRVESVAWVSERKDVLSGLFFVLTLGAYAGYVRRPFSLARYLAVVMLFALGLMAKPMLVTLPLLLPLLDYWPLGRLGWGLSQFFGHHAPSMVGKNGTVPFRCPSDGPASPRPGRLLTRIVLEKIPLVLLAAASCVTTYLVQHGARIPGDRVSLASLVANIPVSYMTYLGQLFYPAGLALFYPHPGVYLPLWKSAAALAALTSISAAIVAVARKHPYLLVGWLWYLGTLVPVIGLVQVGGQGHADRYTYLPHVGLCVAAAWWAEKITRPWPRRRTICGIAAAVLLAGSIACAWRQTSFWRDSAAIWSHTLQCTSKNGLAHHSLGGALAQLGRFDEAVAQYRLALEIQSEHADTYNNLGVALLQLGRPKEALVEFQQAVRGDAKDAAFRTNMADALAELKRFDEAVAQYRAAIELKPEFVEAHYNLGTSLFQQGKVAQAIAQWRELLRIRPDLILVLNRTAHVLATHPDASIRNGAEAVALAQRAVELSAGERPEVLDTLAAAYAEAGRFPEAVATARRALALAEEQDNSALAADLRARIKLYQAGRPFHEASLKPESQARE